tara:strand:- start:144 stop:641 length:498 start_codon:yes stop_codon:yes gene_type:complete
MNVSLLSGLCILGCNSPSQKEVLQKEQSSSPVNAEDLILGRWETDNPHDICVRISKEDRMEISFQRSNHPKHRVYGSKKQIKQENNHYTFHFTPTDIWQERYISPCRKRVYGSKNLDKTNLLDISIIVENPLHIFLHYLPTKDKLKVCLEKTMNPHHCFLLNRVK